MFSIQEKIWNDEWFIGVAVGAFILLLGNLNYLQPLEQSFYRWAMQHTSRDAGKSIAIIAIDDKSLNQLGNGIWSHRQYAELIDLVAPQARVVASTLSFSHASYTPILDNVRELVSFYTDFQSQPELKTLSKQTELLQILEDKLAILDKQSDDDLLFANSVKKAGNVILSISTDFNTVSTRSLESVPKILQQHELNSISTQFDSNRAITIPFEISHIDFPLPFFMEAAEGIAVSNKMIDFQLSPLIFVYKNMYFPSLPLLLAAKNLHINNEQIEINLGKGIRLGDLRIKTDEKLRISPFFYKNRQGKLPFPVYSFIDVLEGKVSAKTFKDKIVLFGMTAQHYSEMQQTPMGNMPTILATAHVLASILNENFLIVPTWATTVQLISWILSIIYLGFILPILRIRFAILASSVLFLVFFLLSFNLFTLEFSIIFIIPMLSILFGHSILSTKRAVVAYQDAFRLHPDAVESNRLLGLAFQGQGHLDMAFEKFRLCPPDEAILSLLYNLALDYELKGQFQRANTVYRYIIKHDIDFRDVQKRLQYVHRSGKERFRGSNGLHKWLSGQSNEKLLLGRRYQLDKLLGKGAMGQVYLGWDSKLNRVVAIKTLALSKEFEDDALEEATKRFFREASAAGCLKHSNIIAIYEVGEEHDLAYISMEFFKGGNLVPYTKRENLLPISTVINIIVKIANALDYAHGQGVIHRDIKPANIMYNPVTEEIKITDFGIAYITDSNKTKTGIILGTPLYMSPEQFAGKKLSGRTDIFSLGVMLYQLLTAEPPFQADSMAALMFKIANEKHTDIIKVRSDIPECIRLVVNKALQKDTEKRYSSGADFSEALKNCLPVVKTNNFKHIQNY